MTQGHEDNRRQEKQGEKRIREQTPTKSRPEKRRRQNSPEPTKGSPQWMEPPTFLTTEEREARDKEDEEGKRQGPSQGLKAQARSPKVLETHQDPEPEPHRSSKTPARASVRSRIREVNNKSVSPGKFPKLK